MAINTIKRTINQGLTFFIDVTETILNFAARTVDYVYMPFDNSLHLAIDKITQIINRRLGRITAISFNILLRWVSLVPHIAAIAYLVSYILAAPLFLGIIGGTFTALIYAVLIRLTSINAFISGERIRSNSLEPRSIQQYLVAKKSVFTDSVSFVFSGLRERLTFNVQEQNNQQIVQEQAEQAFQPEQQNLAVATLDRTLSEAIATDNMKLVINYIEHKLGANWQNLETLDPVHKTSLRSEIEHSVYQPEQRYDYLSAELIHNLSTNIDIGAKCAISGKVKTIPVANDIRRCDLLSLLTAILKQADQGHNVAVYAGTDVEINSAFLANLTFDTMTRKIIEQAINEELNPAPVRSTITAPLQAEEEEQQVQEQQQVQQVQQEQEDKPLTRVQLRAQRVLYFTNKFTTQQAPQDLAPPPASEVSNSNSSKNQYRG